MSKKYEVLTRCIYEGIVYLPGETILMPDNEKPSGALKLIEETKPAKKAKVEVVGEIVGELVAEAVEEVKEEK